MPSGAAPFASSPADTGPVAGFAFLVLEIAEMLGARIAAASAADSPEGGPAEQGAVVLTVMVLITYILRLHDQRPGNPASWIPATWHGRQWPAAYTTRRNERHRACTD